MTSFGITSRVLRLNGYVLWLNGYQRANFGAVQRILADLIAEGTKISMRAVLRVISLCPTVAKRTKFCMGTVVRPFCLAGALFCYAL